MQLQDDPERIKDQQRKGEQEEEKRKAEGGRRRSGYSSRGQGWIGQGFSVEVSVHKGTSLGLSSCGIIYLHSDVQRL